MNYAKYFSANQRATLRLLLGDTEEKQQVISFFATITSCRESTMELSFIVPGGNNADYSFSDEQKIEIVSTHRGMGVSVYAKLIEQLDNRRLKIRLVDDLNHFNRRRSPRVDLDLLLRLEGSTLPLSTIGGRWQHTVKQIKKQGLSSIVNLTRQQFSLSSNGIGIKYATPVQPGNYFLIHLALDDNQPLICIIGEVVRCEPWDNNSFFLGIHFDSIEEDDRQKIERFIS